MRDQILDEDEVLRMNDELSPSFWSDFKYFVGTLFYEMGMVYLLVNLFYFLTSSSMTLIPEGAPYDELFKNNAISETCIALPFSFILMLILIWFINRKVKGSHILKYVYSLFGLVFIFLLIFYGLLDDMLLFNNAGLLLGLTLICLSIFMLYRKGPSD